MDLRLRFCWIVVMLVSGGNTFTVLGDHHFGLTIFLDLTVINEFSTPKLSSFSAPFLSTLETQPCWCARLTDFVRRWVLTWVFYPNSVLSVCGGAWFTRLGYSSVFNSKLKFLTPIIEFISSLMLSFSTQLPRLLWYFISLARLDENSISFIFKMVYGFF